MDEDEKLHVQNGKKDLESTPHLPPLGDENASGRGWARQRGRRWFGLAVVISALGGALWYFHPYVGEYAAKLEQVPGLSESLTLLTQRLEAAERKAQEWTQNNRDLREQFQGLEQKVNSNIEVAREHARSFADELERHLDVRLRGHARWVEGRLEKVEARQNSDNAHMAELQSDLRRLRREIAVLDQDVSRIANINRDMADLQRQLDRSKEEWDALAGRLDRNRLDFEVRRNVSAKITPDILIRLTDTNLRNVRYDAWIRLVSEGRTLWVRNQGVQQPVIFYGKRGDTARELVVTHLTKDSVVGYLLLPTIEDESTMHRVSPRRESPDSNNWANSQ